VGSGRGAEFGSGFGFASALGGKAGGIFDWKCGFGEKFAREGGADGGDRTVEKSVRGAKRVFPGMDLGSVLGNGGGGDTEWSWGFRKERKGNARTGAGKALGGPAFSA